WELVEVASDMACINTMRANELLSSTDLSFLIPGVSFFRREPKVGSHRLDLELSREGQPVYVEIKSVTLCEDQGVGLFPDAPSERATQHVSLLSEMAASGLETHLVFVAMHTGIQSVAPHRLLDPTFSKECIRAHDAGVAFHAMGAEITPHHIRSNGALPLELD
ncbi:MAG: DNA/RNA nuclease SfsA, partial [Litorivicinaceae bacterium]